MFKEIINTIVSNATYSDDLKAKLKDICQYWESISVSTTSKLEEITQKYTYENLEKLRRKDSETTHLEFWKDVGAFALSPALEDHDFDDEFMLFVEDFHDKVEFSFANELDEEEFDVYYELLDRLFYTWISFLWQEANGCRGGIPTCTVENSSTVMFYFNDFLFHNISTYQNEWCDKRIEGTAFIRKLKPIEIYARANRNIKQVNQLINWYFSKENESISVSLNHNVSTVIGKSVNETLIHKPDTNYDNSHDVAAKYFVQKSNELINNDWILKEKSA